MFILHKFLIKKIYNNCYGGKKNKRKRSLKKTWDSIKEIKNREILNEKKDNSIHYQELLLLLQNRTQTLNITQNKKPKTLLTFIRTVYGSLEYLIEVIDDIELVYSKERIIKLHQPENVHVNEWILVE